MLDAAAEPLGQAEGGTLFPAGGVTKTAADLSRRLLVSVLGPILTVSLLYLYREKGLVKKLRNMPETSTWYTVGGLLLQRDCASSVELV